MIKQLTNRVTLLTSEVQLLKSDQELVKFYLSLYSAIKQMHHFEIH